MPSHLFWNTVTEKRVGYLSAYSPPTADTPFSTFSLTFLSDVTPEVVAARIELEFEYWIARYKVPLFGSAFDKTGQMINLKDVRAESHLVGYFDDSRQVVVTRWEMVSNDFFPKDQVEESYLRRTLADIPVKTSDEIQKSVQRESKIKRRGNRLLTGVLIVWAGVPVILDRLSAHWFFVQVAVTSYCVWQFLTTALELLSIVRPSKAKSEESEKKRKMEHYYYHCERNPMGFAKLKVENFIKDREEQIRVEAGRIVDTSSGGRPGMA